MKHERPMGIHGTLIRCAPLLVFGLGGAVALAYSVHTHQRRHGRSTFTLVARPRSRSLLAGQTARYWISIRRGRYQGKIKLSVAAGPELVSDGVSDSGNRVSLHVHGQHALLIVKTASAARAGRYSVKAKAVGGRYRGAITVGLTITALEPASLRIAGNFGPLWPGTAQAVNLALTNPNAEVISVHRLTVSIKDVSAPRATNGLPCSAADFAVTQYAGSYPLKLPASASRNLSALGVPAAEGPQLKMLDRPVNQNGCQGATVILSYSGTATSP